MKAELLSMHRAEMRAAALLWRYTRRHHPGQRMSLYHYLSCAIRSRDKARGVDGFFVAPAAGVTRIPGHPSSA